MLEEFASMNLSPFPLRLEAVEGSQYLQMPETEAWICPSVHYHHARLVEDGKVTAAELGCLLSHLKAIRHAYLSNSNATLVMEDDVDFSLVGLWGESLKNLTKRAPRDWNFIQLYRHLDACLEESKAPKRHPLAFRKKQESKTCYGTPAYIVSRRACSLFNDSFYEDGLLTAKYFWYASSRQLQFTSDSLIYNVLEPNNVYLEEYDRFYVNNSSEELESTIHPDHTPNHLRKTLKILRERLESFRPL